MLLKKALPTFQTIRNNKIIKKIIELLQEQNKLLIEENKSKTAIIKPNRPTIKSQLIVVKLVKRKH